MKSLSFFFIGSPWALAARPVSSLSLSVRERHRGSCTREQRIYISPESAASYWSSLVSRLFTTEGVRELCSVEAREREREREKREERRERKRDSQGGEFNCPCFLCAATRVLRSAAPRHALCSAPLWSTAAKRVRPPAVVYTAYAYSIHPVGDAAHRRTVVPYGMRNSCFSSARATRTPHDTRIFRNYKRERRVKGLEKGHTERRVRYYDMPLRVRWRRKTALRLCSLCAADTASARDVRAIFCFLFFFFFLFVLDTGNERKFASLCWRNLFVGALIRRIAPRAERAKFLPRDRLLFAASCIQKPALLKRRLRRKKKKGEINAVCLIGDWFYSGAKISQLGGSVIT